MKKALLVGINAYPGNALNGCLNDVSDWHDILTTLGGFHPDDIQVITDQRATTQGIGQGLAWLQSGVQSGDEVFFAYSGHGTQVRLYQNDKLAQGMDDAICPVNLDDPDYWENGLITDHWIADWLAHFPDNVRKTLVIDACHSGSITEVAAREIAQGAPTPPPTRPRFLKPPLDISLRYSHPVYHKDLPHRKFGRGATQSGRGLFDFLRFGHRTHAPAKDLSTTVAPINHVLLSGCRSDQTSADAYINGRYNGAFSYFAIKELRADPRRTLDAIHVAYRNDLVNGGYTQEPQLEGPQDRVSGPMFA